MIKLKLKKVMLNNGCTADVYIDPEALQKSLEGTKYSLLHHDCLCIADDCMFPHNRVEEKKGGMPWRAEDDARYWCIVRQIVVECSDHRAPTSTFNYSTGNYFCTEEEAQAHLTYLQALGKVRLAILEANEGWVPDWSNTDNEKYFIYYSNYTTGLKKGLKVSWDAGSYSNYSLPYIKSQEIAEQIIKDYKEELEIIFKKK